jgi:hypothetical protein
VGIGAHSRKISAAGSKLYLLHAGVIVDEGHLFAGVGVDNLEHLRFQGNLLGHIKAFPIIGFIIDLVTAAATEAA